MSITEYEDFELPEELDEPARRKHYTSLAMLPNAPAWDTFLAELERKQKRVLHQLMVEHLNGEPALQREIDFARGQVAALRWAKQLPETAKRALERRHKEAK